MEPHPPPPHLKDPKLRQVWREAARVLAKNHCGIRYLKGYPVVNVWRKPKDGR